MNQEQWLLILRAVLLGVGVLLANHGIINSSDWATISGTIITIFPLAWGLYTTTQSALVKKTAALSDVTKVEVKPTEAGKELAKRSTPDAQIVVGK